MNLQTVRQIIAFYKEHFHAISKEEIYKWRAVKQFQDNWNIEADNFTEMLEVSFRRTGNLLSSGNYYPRRMLHFYAEKQSEKVRLLFSGLYDEETDLIERITNFQVGIDEVHQASFPDKKLTYQDSRAIMAYLCFRFPDRYFFYKYEMFKDFVEKIDYPYQPRIGTNENVLVFLKLCHLLNEEIAKDKLLLEMHKHRLTDDCFFDTSYNILTQDVIYSAVRHFESFGLQVVQKSALERLQHIDGAFSSKPDGPILKGKFINHLENERKNKRIGDRGELLVLEYEQERLRVAASKKIPVLISQTKGDGEGYDILSFGISGEEMFIEVKTSTSHCHTPFFITRNELEKSRIEQQRFYLYRLYDFDEKEDTAKCRIHRGSLTDICLNPILYRVIVDDNAIEEGGRLPTRKS